VVELDARDRDYRGVRLAAFIQDVSERIQRVPGVAAITYSQNGIFSGSDASADVKIPDLPHVPKRTIRWRTILSGLDS